jgi:hypothetical protein
MFVGKAFKLMLGGKFRFSKLISRCKLNQTMKCVTLVKAEKELTGYGLMALVGEFQRSGSSSPMPLPAFR